MPLSCSLLSKYLATARIFPQDSTKYKENTSHGLSSGRGGRRAKGVAFGWDESMPQQDTIPSHLMAQNLPLKKRMSLNILPQRYSTSVQELSPKLVKDSTQHGLHMAITTQFFSEGSEDKQIFAINNFRIRYLSFPAPSVKAFAEGSGI